MDQGLESGCILVVMPIGFTLSLGLHLGETNAERQPHPIASLDEDKGILADTFSISFQF